MAKKTKEELLTNARALVGDSDEAISFLEDISDSFETADTSALDARISELEAQNAQIEKSWREKYISRFGTSNVDVEDNADDVDDDEVVEIPSVEEIAEKF